MTRRWICTISDRVSRYSSDQSGALMVEFIIVTPFLLFLLGFVMRLVLTIQAQQIAMTLSREVATRIFRQCADVTLLDINPLNNQDALPVDVRNSARVIENCLGQARGATLAIWPDLRPPGASANTQDVTLDVSVYRWNFANFAVTDSCASVQPVTKITQSGNQGNSSDGIPWQTVCQRNRMVRARLQFRVTPMVAFLSLIPGAPGAADITIDEETTI